MPESIQESFFKHNLRIFKNLMLNNAWPEMNESRYVKRVDEMIVKCTERGKRVFSISTSGFNCLNHGDFFMRNMLFRRAAVDGRICDVQFVSTKKLIFLLRLFFFLHPQPYILSFIFFFVRHEKIINCELKKIVRIIIRRNGYRTSGKWGWGKIEKRKTFLIDKVQHFFMLLLSIFLSFFLV